MMQTGVTAIDTFLALRAFSIHASTSFWLLCGGSLEDMRSCMTFCLSLSLGFKWARKALNIISLLLASMGLHC